MKVVFAHNVYNRPKTLLETIKKEKKHFPNAKIFVAYNNHKLPMNPFLDLPYNKDISFIYFPQHTHKIGCANGFIHSVEYASKTDADVIFFSHDDVSINEQHLKIFKSNLTKISNGDYDVICRKPQKNYGDNYYMMEGVFMNRKSISSFIRETPVFKSESNIPKDVRGSISPEVFLFNLFNNKGLNIVSHTYDNSTDELYNKQLGETLGLFHKNIGKRGWKE